MVSVRVWKRSGDVPRLPAVARRDGSSLRCGFQTSTQERKTPKALLSFPREARITRGAELQRIVQEGKRIRTTFLEVRAAASPLARVAGSSSGMRIGLIVPRYKHSAVARNQLKRRLRELARLAMLPSGILADVVVRIRPDAYDASFARLAEDISQALNHLGRLESTSRVIAIPNATDIEQP